MKRRDLAGENPHQKAELHQMEDCPRCALFHAENIQGPDLSYNDIVDADAALSLLREFHEEANTDHQVISILFHHGNPCCVALGDTHAEALTNAIDHSDPTSIIEGIYVTNGIIDETEAALLNRLFLHVVIAFDVTSQAGRILRDQQQLTLLSHPHLMEKPASLGKEIRQLVGGYLIQTRNDQLFIKLRATTSRTPSEAEIQQLLIAWKVVKHTKTNAIVLVKGKTTVGIGPGLNNRVWSTQQAIERAGNHAKGSVMASDAILPLPESITLAGEAGVTAIIEPGGWYKESENIKEAEKYGIAILTTGINQFCH